MCQHQPPCPPADALDRQAAHVVIAHPEQGWSLLCNGVVLFDDTGALLPGGHTIAPQPPAHHPNRCHWNCATPTWSAPAPAAQVGPR